MIKEFKLSKRIFLSFTILYYYTCIGEGIVDFKFYLFPNLKIKHTCNDIMLINNIEDKFLGWTSISLHWLIFEIDLAIRNKD